MEKYVELAMDILEEACETDEVREDLDLDLFDAGLIDSLASVVVLIEIENRCGVKLQPTDMEKEDITTVNNFAKFLEKKVK